MASADTVPTPRVERAAGRTPTQACAKAPTHLSQLTRRQAEVMSRAPPPRTPPSIPLPLPRTAKGTKPRIRLMSELDRQVRRAKSQSPHSFLRHFTSPFSRGRAGSARTEESSTAPSPGTEALMKGAVQICQIDLPLSRGPSLPSLFSDFSFSQENLLSLTRQPTDGSLLAERTGLQSIDETPRAAGAETTGSGRPFDRMVSFCQPLAPLLPPKTAPGIGSTRVVSGKEQESLPGVSRQTTSLLSSRSATAIPSSRSQVANGHLSTREFKSASSRPSTQNLARLGRPIAQLTYIYDPDELAVAVQKQKEAAAAVDIQRIFRGYVARNAYKKLVSEERRSMEEKQRAAMEIQRAYRQHVGRKRTIEKRPFNPQLLEWANNYRVNLATRHQQRRAKEEQRSEELADNFYRAHSKLSVIGPHVNIYEIYHPKRSGPTKKELNTAAITIQRHVRGWLVRRRFDKLHRKAAWYGSTFSKMVKEYKTLLIRIQKQHGVEQPQNPFSTKDMNDYIDTRRRYETVFEKKSFGGELEMGDIDSYFKECDLYPSQAEIAKAMEIIFGKGHSTARQSRGLKRQEVLDMVFYIYTPKATGLDNTRQSTWLNPIIDGVEARRLLGSEFVEEAPLEVCAKLVIKTMRERHEKDRAADRARKEREAAELRERLGIPHPKDDEEEEAEREERRRMKRMRRVTLTEPAVKEFRQQHKLEERRKSKEGKEGGFKLEERRKSKEGKEETYKNDERQTSKEGKEEKDAA